MSIWGYGPHDPTGHHSGNSRNGGRAETVVTISGLDICGHATWRGALARGLPQPRCQPPVLLRIGAAR